MYRQILVAPEQRDLLCILWRPSSSAPVQEYQLQTVTYGTASAPYLATRVLKELGDTATADYPSGAKVVSKDFYVDDVMSGDETAEKTKDVIAQVRHLTGGAGFILSKFSSNENACLQSIPEELREKNNVLAVEEESYVKTLGLFWDTKKDEFLFKVQQPITKQSLTIRVLLSEISKIFDPLGWLAPIVVQTKLLMQEVCRESIDWDDSPTHSIQKQWREFQTSLMQIPKIRISRWVHASSTTTQVELHGFSDASERAYAAVVYLRTVDRLNNVSVSLITAKTRIAPATKAISIPRLELCGALLLAELMEVVQESLGIRSLEYRHRRIRPPYLPG